MKPLHFICLFLTLLLTACGAAATALPPETATPQIIAAQTPASTQASVPTVDPNSVPQTGGGSDSLLKEFEAIDKSLSESMKSSIAYNAPTSMNLDDSTTIELLLNPSQSPEDLGKQVTEPGQVQTATIDITPYMKAELISVDKDAFTIQQLHDSPIQPIGSKTVTKWEWAVDAKKAGQQKLTLVISRLVRAQGEDHWTIIQTYKSDVEVKVTIAQMLGSLDWKWILGILVTALIIPGFWRWNDQRLKQREQMAKPKKRGAK